VNAAPIQRVYLLGADLRTVGGYEAQVTLLACGLRKRDIAVEVFMREPVRANHPYWRRMQAAGVRTHAPAAWQAALAQWPRQLYPAGFFLLCLLLSPALLAAVALDALLRRRTLGRAWQGIRGRLRGRLAGWEDFDGLNWWLEHSLDAAARQRPPDIVDVQHSLLPASLAFAHGRGWRLVYTEHGAPNEEFRALWLGLRPVINFAAIIVGRAQASLEGLRRLCGATVPGVVVPQAVLTQPSEADLQTFAPPTEGLVVIGVISRLSREKGLWHLFAAYQRLVDRGVAAEMVVAGDGPLRAELEAEAAQRGYGAHVRFLGAYRNDELGPIVAQMHIVAHPSIHDSRPMAILEAMAWGRPVVASQVGGVTELIADGVEGLLVPAANPAALAAALERLILEPASRECLGGAARARFLAGGFSPDHMVDATLAAYQQAARGRVAAPAK
jgi:glycosyltransferase involved in cell wall biosynthesis